MLDVFSGVKSHLTVRYFMKFDFYKNCVKFRLMRYLHYLFIGILLIAFHTQAIAMCCQIQGATAQVEQKAMMVQHSDHQTAVDCHGASTTPHHDNLIQDNLHDASDEECECDHCVAQLTSQSPNAGMSAANEQVNNLNFQTPHHINTGIEKPPRHIFL